ncbi:MAG: MerR family transcriptional regulator [Acidimicrobiales bacterium]
MLAPPARTPSGYRDYDASVVDRLGFVRAAQSVGLTLARSARSSAYATGAKPPAGTSTAARRPHG